MLNDTISVVQISGRDPMQFAVHVSCGGTTTKHFVTLSETHFRKLSEGRSDPAGLIEAAFRFLLKRESNLKIMDRFDLPAIGQYFPEFGRELPDYLPGVDSSNVANMLPPPKRTVRQNDATPSSEGAGGARQIPADGLPLA